MIKKIFSIYDSKAEFYAAPFFMFSVQEAIRAFSDAVNDKSTPFHKHPEDYTLFEIGYYDDSNADLYKLETPHSLGLGLDFFTTSMPSSLTPQA